MSQQPELEEPVSCLKNGAMIGALSGGMMGFARASLTSKLVHSLKVSVGVFIFVSGAYTGVCKYYKHREAEAVEKFYAKQRHDQEERVLRMYGRKNVEAFEKLFIDAKKAEEDRIVRQGS